MLPIYKASAAPPASADPYEFTMSTADVDRYDEIVEQDWNLGPFKKNPIALWQHNANEPIGVWENVRVEAGRLIGRLKLAARGTSDLIDTLHGLIEQRILRAVSVGFYPHEVGADKDGRTTLSKNELFECSLVSVPANPFAISVAKSAALPAKPSERCWTSATAQLASRPAPARAFAPTPPRTAPCSGAIRMSIAEKITAKQTELANLRDELTELTSADDLTEDITLQIEERSAQIETAQKDLDILERAEQAMAARQAARAEPTQAPQQGRAIQLPRAKGYTAFSTIATLFKAKLTGYHPMELAARELRDQQDVQAVIKAAVDPASTGEPTWAGNLVRESWGEFFGLLRDRAVYPLVPGTRFEFDGSGTVNFPIQRGRGNLAGSFTREGGAVPVAAGDITSVPMTPSRMKVISVFSQELADRSVPSIQSIIRDQILNDTAESIDTALLSDTARVTGETPAGLRDTTEVGSDNIEPTSGDTVAEILGDIKGLLTRLYTARLGGRGAWVMNPMQVIALSVKQDGATGEYPFRDELASGTLRGYPVLQSSNVTNGVVAFIADSAMAFGSEQQPRIDISTQATVHMHSAPSADLGDAGGGVAATPIRSLYQTDSIGIRMSLGLDWKVVREGGVQILTGCDAW